MTNKSGEEPASTFYPSGTLLSVLAQLGVHDMVKTAVLAAIGAAVSFAVTWGLQRWKQRRR